MKWITEWSIYRKVAGNNVEFIEFIVTTKLTNGNFSYYSDHNIDYHLETREILEDFEYQMLKNHPSFDQIKSAIIAEVERVTLEKSAQSLMKELRVSGRFSPELEERIAQTLAMGARINERILHT